VSLLCDEKFFGAQLLLELAQVVRGIGVARQPALDGAIEHVISLNLRWMLLPCINVNNAVSYRPASDGLSAQILMIHSGYVEGCASMCAFLISEDANTDSCTYQALQAMFRYRPSKGGVTDALQRSGPYI
jgi:hypothetical protein